MRRRLWLMVAGLFLLTLIAAAASSQDFTFRFLGGITEIKVRQGLDLQGGSHLVYQADFDRLDRELSEQQKQETMENLKVAIERRVNAFGVGETNIQTARAGEAHLIIAELPGVQDTEQAKQQIGKTAQLQFWEITPEGERTPTDIRAEDLTRAEPGFEQTQTGAATTNPIISFTLRGEAAKRFGELTTRINQTGGRLLITLDEQVLFNGTVSTPILDGRGQMTGFENIEEAKEIATLLNAGALPVPVHLAEQRTVGPTLGQESVNRSLVAGLLGLVLVGAFMLFYYRLLGVAAVAALGIYTLITFAIFKGGLFWLGIPPITLTLAGVAGFILSIGMAVDANILIFERFKEEVRDGRGMQQAIEAGFKRAWTSIRDSNVSTLITTLILFVFGTGPIKGFAVTLAIGVLVSMFTAITLTRTMLRLVLREGLRERLWLFAIRPQEVSAKASEAGRS